MNFLNKNLDFTTVEEGEKQLKDAFAIRDKMGGVLYYNALTDDCYEISQKLERLKREQNSTHEKNMIKVF